MECYLSCSNSKTNSSYSSYSNTDVLNQGHLITDGRKSSKVTGPSVGLNLEIGQNFRAKVWKNSFKWIILQIEGVIGVIFCIRLLLHDKTFKIKKHDCSLFYPLALNCEKWPKMAMFMSAGKQEGVMPLSPFFVVVVDSFSAK